MSKFSQSQDYQRITNYSDTQIDNLQQRKIDDRIEEKDGGRVFLLIYAMIYASHYQYAGTTLARYKSLQHCQASPSLQ